LEKKLIRKLAKLDIKLMEGELCKEELEEYKLLREKDKKYIEKLEDKILKRSFYEKHEFKIGAGAGAGIMALLFLIFK
jgi:hypothetical protein